MATLLTTMREPPGRWTFYLQLADGSIRQFKDKQNLNALIKEVQQYAGANGIVPPSEEDVINQICSRAEGQHCRFEPGESKPLGVILPNMERVGAQLWTSLHVFGIRFHKLRFMAAVDHVTSIVMDAEIGCIVCAQHWQQFLAGSPAHLVTTAEQAAVWTWSAHNGANEKPVPGKSAKPTLPFNQVAIARGWQAMTDSKLQRVKQSLSLT